MNTQSNIAYDLSYLRSIDPSDETFFESMLQQFLTQAPASVIEMKQFLIAENWVGLRREAHKLKPDLICIGAFALEKLIEEIETFSLGAQTQHSLPRLIDELGTGCNMICIELENELKKRTNEMHNS